METWENINTTISNFWNLIYNPSELLQNSIRFLVALLIFFFRILTLIRTIKDANSRSYSFRFVFLSAFFVIFLTPILWIPLYIAIRPQWWKWDKTSWRNSHFLDIQTCENCWSDNLIWNKCCTWCGEHLTTICRECQNEYAKSYNYCPECWAPRLEI